MRLLEEAAQENESVLDDPTPSVIFETFGDNSLGLLLRCFVDSADLRYPAISALNRAINDKFNAAGLGIAFREYLLTLYAGGHLTRRACRVRLIFGLRAVGDRRRPARSGDWAAAAGRRIWHR